MKNRLYAFDARYRFVIEEDSSVGFYLLVLDPKTGASVADHLQDTLYQAMEDADELYGIPKDSWRPEQPDGCGIGD
jgi:hypothetical protein